MARVETSTFAARKGATLSCGKCRAAIAKGERYRHFSAGFRGRKQVRCMRSECTPRQSELTTSKMAGVYAAIEAANDDLDALLAGEPEDDAFNIESALQTASEGIRAVADEYREAAEASPTGLVFGEDYNDKADEIDGAADELEGWSPDDDAPEAEWCELHDEDAVGTEDFQIPAANIDQARLECDDCGRAEEKRRWWEDQIESARSALSDISL